MKRLGAILLPLLASTWLAADARATDDEYRVYIVLNLDLKTPATVDTFGTCWFEAAGVPVAENDFTYRVWIHQDGNVNAVLADSGVLKASRTPVAEKSVGAEGVAGVCYRSRFTCTVWPAFSNEVGTPRKCVLDPRLACPGSPGCSPTGTACTEYTPPEECELSPIVINMGTGRYRISDGSDPVEFDLTADGSPEQITWTERESAMAFLALDRNGNGVIDSGAELFGNHTKMSGEREAANGFDALADFDGNSDGRIDREDSIWSSLLLWTDRNHNGKSESAELQGIAASDVSDLGLDYHAARRRDRAGNMFKYAAPFHRAERADVYYDVYFVRVP